MNKLGAVLTAVAFAVLAYAAVAPLKADAASCNFTRDLTVGSTGEDVRCLQVYLNTTGNARIAAAGPGSVGNETTIYGSLTGAAVARWQTANGIASPNGNFGPASRAKYAALVGGSAPAPTVPTSTDQVRAKIALLEAITAYKDAVNEDGDEDLIEDSATDLLNAMVFYVNGSYTQSIAAANNAKNDAEDSMGNSDDDDDEDDEDNDTSKYEAEDIIDEAESAVSDAEDDVDAAAEDDDADEDDIDEAQDLIAEAEDLIDDAWAEFDDGNYDDAVDLAEEAEDLADEAVDVANGNGSSDSDEDDAEQAIEDAQDELADAQDELDESDADSDDLDEADELLEEAEDLIDDAEVAFDDEDYDEVMDLIDEAEELIDDARELL